MDNNSYVFRYKILGLHGVNVALNRSIIFHPTIRQIVKEIVKSHER